jgi:hypothetical protein
MNKPLLSGHSNASKPFPEETAWLKAPTMINETPILALVEEHQGTAITQN